MSATVEASLPRTTSVASMTYHLRVMSPLFGWKVDKMTPWRCLWGLPASATCSYTVKQRAVETCRPCADIRRQSTQGIQHNVHAHKNQNTPETLKVPCFSMPSPSLQKAHFFEQCPGALSRLGH